MLNCFVICAENCGATCYAAILGSFIDSLNAIDAIIAIAMSDAGFTICISLTGRFILSYVISQRLVNEKTRTAAFVWAAGSRVWAVDLGKRMEAEHAHSAKHPSSRHPHGWHRRLTRGRPRPRSYDRCGTGNRRGRHECHTQPHHHARVK
jgi:hypothetical protein